MNDAAVRRTIVASFTAFTHSTPAEPTEYERYLLTKYVDGRLSLEEVLRLLAVAHRGSSD